MHIRLDIGTVDLHTAKNIPTVSLSDTSTVVQLNTFPRCPLIIIVIFKHFVIFLALHKLITIIIFFNIYSGFFFSHPF